jgi:hypothetical protein
MWTLVSGGSPSNKVRYYFSLSITNQPTLQVITRAATNGGLKPFPGEKFSVETEPGKALLGE